MFLYIALIKVADIFHVSSVKSDNSSRWWASPLIILSLGVVQQGVQ